MCEHSNFPIILKNKYLRKKNNLGAGSLGNEIKIQMPCNFIDFPELSDFNSQLQCVCMTLSKTS